MKKIFFTFLNYTAAVILIVLAGIISHIVFPGSLLRVLNKSRDMAFSDIIVFVETISWMCILPFISESIFIWIFKNDSRKPVNRFFGRSIRIAMKGGVGFIMLTGGAVFIAEKRIITGIIHLSIGLIFLIISLIQNYHFKKEYKM